MNTLKEHTWTHFEEHLEHTWNTLRTHFEHILDHNGSLAHELWKLSCRDPLKNKLSY